jgi:23S rRNA (cytosine1962-C5)-methyltransferase
MVMPVGRVILKPRKAQPLFGRHPWVRDTAVERVEGAPPDGAEVDLLSHQGAFIARGLFNSRSRIRVRLYTWEAEQPLDENFWQQRLESALRLRQALGYADPAGAARLVASEGDGLSGLVVDRYADYLVVQVTALGIARRMPQLLPMLVDMLQPRGIVLRTERGAARLEGLDLRDGPGWGQPPPEQLLIVENGLRYQVDVLAGQKTGFYLDQRENRRAATEHLANRRVLDMFCYSGGFALAAARRGAVEVLGIDSSEKALALARSNATLNSLVNVRFESGDCFSRMEALLAAGERFGAVILDPPKFARHRSRLSQALRAYHWLNRLAVELLEPEGVLVTCSCSGHVSREDFLQMLLGVAQQTGRDIQVLQTRGAAPDHPVAVTCLDGEYLKCLICRVI